ncbi:MAG TPA: glycosyltransferase [Saprospiraceae bacterium]|nr:glycosyltransferase [Saprospiraceae bacterium]
MNPDEKYLLKYGSGKIWVTEPIPEGLEMAVVIPACNEPDILKTLYSLKECLSPPCHVEVFVVINESEQAMDEVKIQNDLTYHECSEWIKTITSNFLSFHCIKVENIQNKVAGVGFARKLGMDEAARRLPGRGIIVSLDADSLVNENYLTSLHRHFQINPQSNGCSIYFEHPLYGTEFEPDIYDKIIQYELHLRYFVDRQRWLSLPYAYQTVGSSMAVLRDAYINVGGMNKRKAGEDFYFLQKLIKQGRFTECNETTVIPSPRYSDRVPFGTGKAISAMIKENSNIYYTYHPSSFEEIKRLLESIASGYESESFSMDGAIIQFLDGVNFMEKIANFKCHSTGWLSFQKRYYQWFDSFLLMKLLHSLRDIQYPDIPVMEAVKMVYGKSFATTPKDALIRFRKEAIEKYSLFRSASLF